jgi:hypothetical protein
MASPVLVCALVATSVCILLWYTEQRRRWLRAEWPPNLSFHGLKRRVERYFVLRGWKLRHVDCKEYQFIVSHNAEEFAVKIYPSGLRSFSTSVKDMIDANVVGKRCIIYVSVEQASHDELELAQKMGVFVINYRLLDRVTALNPASVKAVRELVLADSDQQ